MIKQNTTTHQPHKQQKHPLSACWPTSSRAQQGKLSFFGKGITCIDRLDSVNGGVLGSVRELDLSHNAIAKVENMRQFCNLEVVNFAHNYITDGKYIAKLSKLPKIRSVYVKGNPFLKSGQGKLPALKYLLPLSTDIQILSHKQQSLLSQTITQYARQQVNRQYLAHIEVQIEMITEFNIGVADTSVEVYERVVGALLEERVEGFGGDCRGDVVKAVAGIEGLDGEGGDGRECREMLQQWFEKCLYQYNQRLQTQIQQQQKTLSNKLQTLHHIKSLRLQRYTTENYLTNFRRPTKPLLPKPNLNFNMNNENIIPVSTRHSGRQIGQYDKNAEEELRKIIGGGPHIGKKGLEEKFEAYYGSVVMKYSPVYQLLYSPLASLKNKQKDLLIETLSTHLRQKSFSAYKNQHHKQHLTQLTKKYLQKQHTLKTTQQKFLQQKLLYTQKSKQLEQALEQSTQYQRQILQLLGEKEMLIRDCNQIHEEMGELKLVNIRQSGVIERVVCSEENYERIQQMRDMRLKKEILGVVRYKADRLGRLRHLQKVNRGVEDRELVGLCFQGIRDQVEIRKKGKFLQSYVNRGLLKYSINLFIGTMRLEVAQTKLKTLLLKTPKTHLIQTLTKTHQTNQHLSHKLTTHLTHKNTQTLHKCLTQWRQHLHQQAQSQKLQKIAELHEAKILARAYRSWLVFVKLPVHKQAELSVDLKLRGVGRFFVGLRDRWWDGRVLREKFGNLVVFLNGSKRINYFCRFKNYILSKRQTLNINHQKLTNHLLTHHLQKFLTSTKQLSTHTTQLNQKHKKLLSLRVRGTFNQLTSEQNMRKLRSRKLYNLFANARRFQIGQCLRASLKEFMIEDWVVKGKVRGFFGGINRKFKEELKLRNKTIELRYVINTNRFNNQLSEQFRLKKQFFQSLSKPSALRKKLRQFLNRKYYNLMRKCYKQWRVEVFKTEIYCLKNRIKEFGPQIQQISKRQKTVFEEKLVLMNIIDSKQKTIRGFIKQLEEAEYTIKTKQEKYKKLKQFIHETGASEDITVMGSKVQSMSECFIPERDFEVYSGDTNKQDQYFSNFRRF